MALPSGRRALCVSLLLLPAALRRCAGADAGTAALLAQRDAAADAEACGATSLLQVQAEPSGRAPRKAPIPEAALRAGEEVRPGPAGTRHFIALPASQDRGDLVLQHVPFNFGHTIEKVAAMGSGDQAMAKYIQVQVMEDKMLSQEQKWNVLKRTMRPNGIAWGHMNPGLQMTSSVTGCPLYFTPGKYWPKEVAEAYFGNKTVFGMLRDPFERLVAMFRGDMSSYGGSYPTFIEACDVNGAVRQMMLEYLAGDVYAHGCTFVPQAEYFDPPFGIDLAVDNRRFPDSVNELFAQHNYSDIHIAPQDILHVRKCSHVWAGDLDCETRALVKKVYARDLDLLCQKFGYCDFNENTCIQGVPGMCPPHLKDKQRTAVQCQ